MKTTYSITYNLKEDMWNWLSVAKTPISHGFNWYDNLNNDADRQMFRELQNLPELQAKAKLKKYIQQKAKSKDFIVGIEFIKKRYEQDFQKACKWLEKITKKPLAFPKYTIYITTFPRAPYSPDDGSMFCHYSWINPIVNFVHEALHIQCHKYWRDNPESPVSKLSEQNWEALKESLTVIIDKKYVNFIEMNDRGYDQHQELRKKLWQCWEKEQDFDKLVAVGLENLSTSSEK